MKATAEILSVKLEEPHYRSADDALDMVDLLGEPSSDAVRNIWQKVLTVFQTRDASHPVGLMLSSGMCACSLGYVASQYLRGRT